MCLAIPGRVEQVHETNGMRMARVRFGGLLRTCCLETVPEAAVGDHVLVHVGFALAVIDDEEARRTWEALERLEQLDELDAPGASPAAGRPT